MCLAIPGRVVEKEGNRALVDYGGVQRNVRVDVVDAKVGDWVYVHAGYAIQVLDEEEAEKTLELFREIGGG